MSKWNKQTPQLSEQFLQNQQRRKQMIIEAAKRRKEQQKKQTEIKEKERKNSQEALSKHKQQKKDAYIKYLRSNMHDKYQDKHRKQKENQEIQSNAKWKKKSPPKPTSPQQLQALDLDVHLRQDPPSQNNPSKQQKQKITEEFQKQWIAEEFQQEWKQKEEEELLSSQLLDSLDLDLGTVSRQKQVRKIMKEKGEEPQWPTPGTKPFQDQLKRLKEMIGYDSMVMESDRSKATSKQEPKQKKEIKGQKVQNKRKVQPQGNQVQTFNELRHKKQAKIMNWAQDQQNEADDLFSNCSSRKKSTIALRQINEELKSKKHPASDVNLPMPIISEQVQTRPQPKQIIPTKNKISKGQPKSSKGFREESLEKNSAKGSQKNITKPNRLVQQKQRAKEQIGKRSNSVNKQPPKTTANFRTNENRDKSRGRSQEKRERSYENQRGRQNSYENQRAKVEPVHKIDPARKTTPNLNPNLPPLPFRPQSNNSNATYDINIDVQSFIKQDLISLNENERQLQKQLRDIHINHKTGIKEVFEKYEIRTDYKHSSEITGDEDKVHTYSYKPTEDSIEDSIQNLDNLLIRRQILQREKHHAIPEQTLEDENSKSLINPFSNSDALCQQVLQLAKNVSRFEAKAEEPVPQGYLSKAKRANSKQRPKQRERQRQKENVIEMDPGTEYVGESLCESEQVSNIQPLQNPPSLVQQKIHVNKNLLKGLLDDSDLID